MSARKKKPQVAVVDWRPAPASNSAAKVEAKVIGKTADVKYYLADTEDDFTPAILNSDAIILWQNTTVTERTIAKMTNCRVFIRNGVGYDTVDIDAAARLGIPVCNVPDYRRRRCWKSDKRSRRNYALDIWCRSPAVIQDKPAA